MGEERTTALAGLCGVMNLMLLLSCGGVGCEVEVQVWPPRVEGFTEALVKASAVRFSADLCFFEVWASIVVEA